MKKFLLCFVLLIPFLMTRCDKSVKLEDSMSEITKIYFSAENDDLKGSISVGEREVDYEIDGKHTQNCEFSLISLKFANLLPENQIEVEIVINEKNSKILLELNPANHFYMTDLGYALNENDKISISFNDFNLNFENISQNFGVGYKEALKISKEALGKSLDKYYEGNDFNGEAYLKILTEQDQTNELFWVFTVVGKNDTKNNVVLNVVDGRVIISD